MKRNVRSIRLSKETLHRLNSIGTGAGVFGGLGSVRASCLTEQQSCDTHNASCPGNCLTDHCYSRTYCP